MRVQSLALLNGLRIRRCHGLWRRPAATAPIGPLAWKPPHAMGVALKRQKKKKKKDWLKDILQIERKLEKKASWSMRKNGRKRRDLSTWFSGFFCLSF